MPNAGVLVFKSLSIFKMDIMYKKQFKNRLKYSLICVLLALGSNAYPKDILDDLIKSAIETYPSVESKKMLAESAESELQAAKWGFLPSVSVGYRPSGDVLGSSTQVNEGRHSYRSVVISQTLLGGGKLATYRQSKAALQVADWSKIEEQELVAVRVINAYAAWSLANEKLKIASETLKEYERLLAQMKRRVEGGVSPATEQNLTSSRLLQARSEYVALQSAENTAFTTLNQLTGSKLDKKKLVSSLQLAEDKLLNDVIQKTVDRSPLLNRLKSVADTLKESSKIVRAESLPQVVLKAQYDKGNTFFNSKAKNNSINLELNYAADGAGVSTFNRMSAADDRYQAALIDVVTAKRDLIVKLDQDVSDFAFAKSKIPALEKNVEISAELTSSYDRLFIVGKKSWMDLMNAIRERKDSRFMLSEAQAQVIATNRRLKIYTEGLSEYGVLNDTSDKSGFFGKLFDKNKDQVENADAEQAKTQEDFNVMIDSESVQASAPSTTSKKQRDTSKNAVADATQQYKASAFEMSTDSVAMINQRKEDPKPAVANKSSDKPKVQASVRDTSEALSTNVSTQANNSKSVTAKDVANPDVVVSETSLFEVVSSTPIASLPATVKKPKGKSKPVAIDTREDPKPAVKSKALSSPQVQPTVDEGIGQVVVSAQERVDNSKPETPQKTGDVATESESKTSLFEVVSSAPIVSSPAAVKNTKGKSKPVAIDTREDPKPAVKSKALSSPQVQPTVDQGVGQVVASDKKQVDNSKSETPQKTSDVSTESESKTSLFEVVSSVPAAVKNTKGKSKAVTIDTREDPKPAVKSKALSNSKVQSNNSKTANKVSTRVTKQKDNVNLDDVNAQKQQVNTSDEQPVAKPKFEAVVTFE